MKRLIPIILLALLASCDSKKSKSDVDEDEDEIEAELTEDSDEETEEDSGQPIKTKKFTFTKQDEFAEVSLEVNMPVGNAAAKNIAKSMWRNFYRMVSTDYGAGTNSSSAYSGNLEDGNEVLKYYGSKAFSSIHNDSEQEYESNLEYYDPSEGYDEPSVSQFQLSATVALECELEHLVVFRIESYVYAGGAHGGASFQYYIYDKKTGRPIKEILKPSMEAQLQRQMHVGLMKYFECSLSQLADELLIEATTIPWPSTTPYPSEKGVTFVYQQYEIAPYSAGTPEFTIPYKDLEGMLLCKP